MTSLSIIILTYFLIFIFIVAVLAIRNTVVKVSRLESQLDHKNKELTSYALNFVRKNELIDEISVKITSLKPSDHEVNKELNRIDKLLNDNFKIDEDWKNFKLSFEEVHNNFFSRLKHVCQDISNAELKLCALIKLNLSLKETAPILGISPTSVKTARYRLRKKLGLATEESLVDFLILIEQGARVKPVRLTKRKKKGSLFNLQHSLASYFTQLVPLTNTLQSKAA